ncbi:hypothetical protein [Rhizobium sp. Root1204]|uniref:hypothetical protein n=1 Tax=unclassified Rhizobium TaxID=2613769 RepID=UPI0009E7308F
MMEANMAGDLHNDVRERLEDFVDTFVVKGARAGDVIEIIIQEAVRLREAYDRDPDPADDSGTDLDAEPSNDWPSAGSQPKPGGS